MPKLPSAPDRKGGTGDPARRWRWSGVQIWLRHSKPVTLCLSPTWKQIILCARHGGLGTLAAVPKAASQGKRAPRRSRWLGSPRALPSSPDFLNLGGGGAALPRALRLGPWPRAALDSTSSHWQKEAVGGASGLGEMGCPCWEWGSSGFLGACHCPPREAAHGCWVPLSDAPHQPGVRGDPCVPSLPLVTPGSHTLKRRLISGEPDRQAQRGGANPRPEFHRSAG